MDFFRTIRHNIETCGQHLVGVFPTKNEDGDPFVYTIGNAERNLPELILIGPFGPPAIAGILNLLGERQRKLERALEGDIDLGGRFPARIRKASESVKSNFTIQVGQFFGREDYDVLQVMFCDKEGRFPGEHGCQPPFDVELV